ncbi:hypothetical protein [Undibacterium sp.]|uniref:hypothetical protein n=1 Tax=Undibacterium sp. TaxID=1914977 RepID=UPI00374D4EDE
MITPLVFINITSSTSVLPEAAQISKQIVVRAQKHRDITQGKRRLAGDPLRNKFEI